MASQTSRTPGLTVSQSLNAQANPDHAAKIWELGTYPGGTWVTTCGSMTRRDRRPRDASAIGDGSGYTHTLEVPLFGPTAGKWTDLGTLPGEQSIGCEEPLDGISNTGLVVSHSITSDGYMHAVAWTQETGMVDLGLLRIRRPAVRKP